MSIVKAHNLQLNSTGTIKKRMHSQQQMAEFLSSVDLSRFNNSYEQACLFYFGLLRELDLKIIYTQIQIENSAVTHQKSKKQIKSTKQKQEISAKVAVPEKLQKHYPFECRVKGCGKGFDKKSALDHHETLRHKMQATEWASNRIFNIEIKEVKQSTESGSKRASRAP